MSQPGWNYMAKIADVACAYDSETMQSIGDRLQEQWCYLEDWCAANAYDMFADRSELRAMMQALVRLLYRVPGANVADDLDQIRQKNKEYGGSWCKRGGAGAFFMLSRKWDRIEEAFKKTTRIDQLVLNDSRTEGILDDFGDLRRYLILVLAMHEARGQKLVVEDDIKF